MKKEIYCVCLSLLIATSCSFRPNGDDKKSSASRNQLEIQGPEDFDIDGDGVLDKDDPEPFLANIPSIGGEMFRDLSISFAHQGKRHDIKVLRDHLGVADYIQYLSEKNSRNGDHVRTSVDSDYLNIFTFSNSKYVSIPSPEDQWRSVDDVKVQINSDFLFNNSKDGSYTNLRLELYLYNHAKMDLEQVSSVVLKDKFYFNQKSNKTIIFNVSHRSPELIVNDKGRSLFLKVKDFTILESGQSYQRVLQNTLSKSVPVIVNSGGTSVTSFVSARKARVDLLSLLRLSNFTFKYQKGEFFEINNITNNEAVTLDYFGNTIKDTNRWTVITKDISSDYHSYTYGIGDFVYFNYMSKIRPRTLRPKLHGKTGTSRNQRIFSSAMSRDSLERSRILFRPISFKGETTRVFSLADCSFDKCFGFESRFIDGEGLEAISSLFFLTIMINNETFNAGILFDKGLIELKKLSDNETFELILSPEIRSKFKKDNLITLQFESHRGMSCSGIATCSGINCLRYFDKTKPTCSDSSFMSDLINYEVRLDRKMNDWDGNLFIGFEILN